MRLGVRGRVLRCCLLATGGAAAAWLVAHLVPRRRLHLEDLDLFWPYRTVAEIARRRVNVV